MGQAFLWLLGALSLGFGATPGHAIDLVESGKPGARGNLLAIQPEMREHDYQSPRRLAARVSRYLEIAREKGWLTPKTVAVLPEFYGTWLVGAEQQEAFYESGSLEGAMFRLVLAEPVAFLKELFRATAPERSREAVFRLRAPRMAALYEQSTRDLAQRYGITLVAGSIVLPGPRLDSEGHLRIDPQKPLENVSVVARPDGSLAPALVRKAFPISEERGFVRPAPVESLPVFETPAGRLGVLICADSWYPQAYAELAAKRAELIAVPSFIDGHGKIDAPWGGYDGAPAPRDVDPADVGRLSEREAWTKYSLPGRLAQAGARAGVISYLRGRFWGVGSEGESLVTVASEGHPDPDLRGAAAGRVGRVQRANPKETEALVNLWL